MLRFNARRTLLTGGDRATPAGTGGRTPSVACSGEPALAPPSAAPRARHGRRHGGGRGALAVPDAAVAYVVAGMCRLGERRPLLVVTPTVRRRRAARPRHRRLPRERRRRAVPGVGHPALRARQPRAVDHGAAPAAAVATARPRRAPPAVIVAPVRALLQRLGPVEEAAVPVRGGARRPSSTNRSW